jgi:hypothetical protein
LFLQETGFIQTFTEALARRFFETWRDIAQAMQRLPARWPPNRRIHVLYASAILAVIHYLWLVKADIRKPLEYGTVLAFLLIESSKNCVLADTSLRFHPPSALPFCKTECFVHQPRWDDVVCAGGF